MNFSTLRAQPSPVKAHVRAYLAANPDLADGTVNEVLSSLRTVGIPVGRTTVAEVLQERRGANKGVHREYSSRLS
jgi:hypothetical protein